MEKNEITVSKARRICPVLDESNQEQWLELAERSTNRQIEREVARVAPRTAIPESARFLTDTLLELKIPVSSEIFEQIERARELLRSKLGRAVSIEETVGVMANEYLTRHDPQRKAERAKLKQIQNSEKENEKEGKPKHTSVLVSLEHSSNAATNSVPETNNSCAELKECYIERRKPLRAEVRHEVHLRDKSQCQYRKTTGQICGNRSFLEFHHKTPVGQGGLDTADNLVLYCSGHHRVTHIPLD